MPDPQRPQVMSFVKANSLLPFGYLIALQLLLHFVEKLSRDERLMLSLIPVAASLRIFEYAVIKSVLEEQINIAEREMLVALRPEVQLEFEPVIDLPPGPSLVGDFLEHLASSPAHARDRR